MPAAGQKMTVSGVIKKLLLSCAARKYATPTAAVIPIPRNHIRALAHHGLIADAGLFRKCSRACRSISDGASVIMPPSSLALRVPRQRAAAIAAAFIQ